MRHQISLLALGSSLLWSGCTVNDSEKAPDEKRDGETTSLNDPAQNPLAISLNFQDGNTFKSEALKLSWSSKEGSICALKANGTDIAANLNFAGSLTHSPDADTTYELSCENTGTKGTVTGLLKLLPDEVVSIPIYDKADIGSIIDLNSLSQQACGEGIQCFFMDLEPDYFKKSSGGWNETDKFIQALKVMQNLSPIPKAIEIESTKTYFNETKSAVYGVRGEVDNANFTKLCEEQSPIKSGGSLGYQPQFSNLTGNGFEEFSNGVMNVNLFSDLSFTTSARRSIVTKGSAVVANYNTAQIGGQISANYQEYRAASGSFDLLPDTAAHRATSLATPFSTNFSEPLGDVREFSSFVDSSSIEMFRAISYPPVPPRYVLPARGYGGDPNAFVPTDSVCYLSFQNVTLVPWQAPVKFGPLTDYFPLSSSKRIVRGAGTVSCPNIDGASARKYGLGEEWTAEVSNAWWFVTDGNWPSCGGYECTGKSLLTSMTTLWSEIEPVKNFCISRYQGLEESFSSYYSQMLKSCREAEAYKKAVAAELESANSLAFRKYCNDNTSCFQTVNSLNWLAWHYNFPIIKRIIEDTTIMIDQNKKLGTPYIIERLAFEPFTLKNLDYHLSFVESNVQAIESKRLTYSPQPKFSSIYPASPISDLMPNLDAKHEPLFSESASILKTVQDYREFRKKIAELSKLSVGRVNCGFESVGKFRKYEGVAIGDLEITSLAPQKANLSTLRDLKIN